MNMILMFFMFLRVGVLGFGGGNAIIPLVVQTVRDLNVISEADIQEMLTLAQIVPGALAINSASYVGFVSSGVIGAILAVLGIIVPSFILVTLVEHYMTKFNDSPVIKAAFMGIRPVTVAFVGTAVVYIAELAFFGGRLTLSDIKGDISFTEINTFVPIIIFVCALIANGKLKVHPIVVTLAGGAIGAIFLS